MPITWKAWIATAALCSTAAFAQTPAAGTAPAPMPAPAAKAAAAPAAKAEAAPKTAAKTAAPGGGAGKVWGNAETKVYHCQGDRYYGTTKAGEYMSQADAKAKGMHAAKNSKNCKA